MGCVGTENRAWNECGGAACKRWEMQDCRMGSFEGREEGRQVCWRRAGQTSEPFLGTVEEESSKDVVWKPHSVTVWLLMSSSWPFLRVAACVSVNGCLHAGRCVLLQSEGRWFYTMIIWHQLCIPTTATAESSQTVLPPLCHVITLYTKLWELPKLTRAHVLYVCVFLQTRIHQAAGPLCADLIRQK